MSCGLQDAIFALAYTIVESLCIVTKRDWEATQKTRQMLQMSSFVPTAFRPLKVNDWLVSRRYFASAARAWIGAQSSASCARLVLKGYGLWVDNVRCLSVSVSSKYDFACETTLKRMIFNNVGHCARLQRLELAVDAGFFSSKSPGKNASERSFTDKDIETCVLPWELGGLSGIPNLTLRAYKLSYGSKSPDVLDRNVKKLERYLHKRLADSERPDAISNLNAAPDYRPLYLGSKVLALPGPGPRSGRLSLRASHHEPLKRLLGFLLDDFYDGHNLAATTVANSSSGNTTVSPEQTLQDKDFPNSYAGFMALGASDPFALYRWASEKKGKDA